MVMDLGDSFVLNPENIRANHQGRLTEQQQIEMRYSRLIGGLGSLLAIVVLAGLMLSPLVNRIKDLDAITLIWLEVMLAIPLTFICVYGIARWQKFTDDIKTGHIAYVSGSTMVGSYTIGRSIQRHYKAIISDVSFEIPLAVAKQLDTTREHKLYYARKSKFLLSIEAI